MSVKKVATPENDDLEYILDILEDMDAMEDDDAVADTGSFLGKDAGDIVPALESDKDATVKDIELLLLSALQVYVFDKDRCLLEQSLQIIASYAAALPQEQLRPALRSTSSRIDALLAFTDLWEPSCWRDTLFGETPEDVLFQNTFERGRGGVQECRSVPYLAFLLAGTGFPFTEDELRDIQSDAWMSVADVRESVRGKEGGKR